MSRATSLEQFQGSFIQQNYTLSIGFTFTSVNGFNFKSHKTPDLSRYSQYYQPQNQSGQSETEQRVLSSNAAANALRTYSLTSGSSLPSSYNSNKNVRAAASASASKLRTNSLTNQSRLNSLNSNSQRFSSSRTNSLLSSANTMSERIIIIKTQNTQGRTQSITREIIQNFGNYEISKRELINDPSEIEAIERDEQQLNSSRNGSLIGSRTGSFGSSNGPFGNVSMNANGNLELNAIQEEEDGGDAFDNFDSANVNQDEEEEEAQPTSAPMSPIRSILKSSSPPPPESPELELGTGSKEEDIEDDVHSDGGSVYSDAFETLPKNKLKNKQLIKNKSKKRATFASDSIDLNNTGANSSRLSSLTSQTSYNTKFNQGPLRRGIRPTSNAANAGPNLTQEQLYQQAYHVALKKVYGDDDSRSKARGPGSQSETKIFKSYSLRDKKPSPNGMTNSEKTTQASENGTSAAAGMAMSQSKRPERRLDIDSDEEPEFNQPVTSAASQPSVMRPSEDSKTTVNTTPSKSKLSGFAALFSGKNQANNSSKKMKNKGLDPTLNPSNHTHINQTNNTEQQQPPTQSPPSLQMSSNGSTSSTSMLSPVSMNNTIITTPPTTSYNLDYPTPPTTGSSHLEQQQQQQQQQSVDNRVFSNATVGSTSTANTTKKTKDAVKTSSKGKFKFSSLFKRNSSG
ncbi:hypothetical protein WICPIJ_007599 [Wickerhamomyces pijperi]|uniref:Uncharacterized protein n=1 Tax=Wickerhamomyces pijperi TaxID=599730 RepID=A0A9P8Q082_WICPI|nr:hypothetical protein WICPIJ_007599 [Wickerhamomyces pijperi]